MEEAECGRRCPGSSGPLLVSVHADSYVCSCGLCQPVCWCVSCLAATEERLRPLNLDMLSQLSERIFPKMMLQVMRRDNPRSMLLWARLWTGLIFNPQGSPSRGGLLSVLEMME